MNILAINGFLSVEINALSYQNPPARFPAPAGIGLETHQPKMTAYMPRCVSSNINDWYLQLKGTLVWCPHIKLWRWFHFTVSEMCFWLIFSGRMHESAWQIQWKQMDTSVWRYRQIQSECNHMSGFASLRNGWLWTDFSSVPNRAVFRNYSAILTALWMLHDSQGDRFWTRCFHTFIY